MTRNYRSLMVREVEKRYSGSRAAVLSGVSLSIAPGGASVLLGTNGSGKTTLLKLIGGLLRPDAGVISMDGCHSVVERKALIGMVPQHNNLDRRMSVRDNLLYNALMYGGTRRCRLEQIEAIAARFTFNTYLDTMPPALSGGTARKVVLARAFLALPALLILDEPTNHLDPVFRRILFKAIEEFRASGGLVLLSTHNSVDIDAVDDARVSILHGGVLVDVEDAKQAERVLHELIEEPVLIAGTRANAR